MTLHVKEVSEMAGVSIRTLHHYDAIGLLAPSSTSPAGYRVYLEQDLERLQQILFFKEIGFSLNEIKEILESPGFDRAKALLAHRELLMEKRDRMDQMIRTVERSLKSIQGGLQMEEKELFEGFDMNRIKEHQEKYRDEARQKWGEDIVDASERRVKGYSEEKWSGLYAAMDDIYKRLASRMEAGPKDPEVQEAVQAWHHFITDNFYDCSLEIFRGLGNLYVDDERFTANIDKHKPGLAQFMKDAMHIYCDRMEGK